MCFMSSITYIVSQKSLKGPKMGRQRMYRLIWDQYCLVGWRNQFYKIPNSKKVHLKVCSFFLPINRLWTVNCKPCGFTRLGYKTASTAKFWTKWTSIPYIAWFGLCYWWKYSIYTLEKLVFGYWFSLHILFCYMAKQELLKKKWSPPY